MILLAVLLAALLAGAPDPKAAESSVQETREATRQLMELSALPSFSGDTEATRAASEWIATRLRGLGFTTRTLQTEGNPLLFAERPASSPADTAPVVLFYMHYDTQPSGPKEDWASTGGEPFRPTLLSGRWDDATTRSLDVGQLDATTIAAARLYARGVADDKAPIVMHLRALARWVKSPAAARLHLKYLLDGEEEAGSTHIASALTRHRDLLRANLLVLCDGPMDALGRPSVYLGARGDMHMKLTVRTAALPAHSGNYGLLPNAAWRLAALLATMKDADGRVTIDGFNDGVVPPTAEEVRAMTEASRAEPAIAAQLGVTRFEGDARRSYYERLLFTPGFVINQLASGRPGNQIPVTAEALLEVRLVTKQDPAAVFEAVRRHVASHMPEAELIDLGGSPAARMDAGDSIIAGAIDAVTRAAGQPVLVYPSLGGTLPLLNDFAAAGHKFVGLPLVNFDNNQHVGNENLKVAALPEGIALVERLLGALAEPPTRRPSR